MNPHQCPKYQTVILERQSQFNPITFSALHGLVCNEFIVRKRSAKFGKIVTYNAFKTVGGKV